MREIKFRGRHIHTIPCNEHLNGTWVYGYLVAPNYIDPINDEFETLVDENTIGQYTGLKDMNGKEIYEGDILAYNLKNNIKTCLGEVRFGKAIFYVKWRECIYYRMDLEYWSTRVEVIGNIYENAELLEKI